MNGSELTATHRVKEFSDFNWCSNIDTQGKPCVPPLSLPGRRKLLQSSIHGLPVASEQPSISCVPELLNDWLKRLNPLFSLFDSRKIGLIICLSKKLFAARVVTRQFFSVRVSPIPSVIPGFCGSVSKKVQDHIHLLDIKWQQSLCHLLLCSWNFGTSSNDQWVSVVWRISSAEEEWNPFQEGFNNPFLLQEEGREGR